MVMAFSLFSVLFLALTVDPLIGNVQNLLFVISIFCLTPIFFIGLIRKKGFIPFFPTGNPGIIPLIISFVIAIGVGLLFSFTLSSILPQPLFSIVTLSTDFIETVKTFVIYVLLPAFNEELAFGAVFVLFYLGLNFIFNRNNTNKGTALTILMVSLFITFMAFGFEHYDAQTKTQAFNYQNYQNNPSQWIALHPNAPIPAVPGSAEAGSQILISLLVNGLFRIVNTLIGVLTLDYWQMVKNHALVNGLVMVISPLYITYGKWEFILLTLAFMLLLDLINGELSRQPSPAI